MNALEIIILGIIQGLTEFIPISSSGHLDIIPRLLGWENPSTTLILALHLGTLLSLLVYYRKLIKKYLEIIFKKFIRRDYLKRKEERNAKTLNNVIVAMFPALIFGALLENLISNFYDDENNIEVVAPFILIPMIIFGVFFLFEERLFKNNSVRIQDLKWNKAFIIGLSQVVAFIRGVSRSGITLLTGQALGLRRVDAAEFSFLISIPILSATSIYGIYNLLQLPADQMHDELVLALMGLITAFISGLLAVSFLLKFLKNNSLKIFGVYRIIFGIILLILILK